MKWLRYLVALVCAVDLSCASDGGPVGTGISSTSAISGNIIGVQTATGTTGSDNVAATLPAIRVSIDGLSNVATTADGGGNFLLNGNFAGSVTVRFTVPQFQVTQQLDVPGGSTVVLQDIELQPDGVVAQSARQLDFLGTVDLVDCPPDGTLLIHERRSGGMQFLVRLNDLTSFVDAAGGTQTCAAIRVGSSVAVEGSIAYATDRTITALLVTIAPPMPPTQPQRQARFSGVLAVLDCSAGLGVVDDSGQLTSIQLTAQTVFTGPSGVLTCQDLHLGDPVRGEGQINLRMPGAIVTTQLVVTGPPSLGQSLHFAGFVTTIDCADGVLHLRNDKTAFDVLLSAMTMMTGRNGQALTCTDIQPGDHVEGLGAAAAGDTGILDAARIRVTGREIGTALDGLHNMPK